MVPAKPSAVARRGQVLGRQVGRGGAGEPFEPGRHAQVHVAAGRLEPVDGGGVVARPASLEPVAPPMAFEVPRRDHAAARSAPISARIRPDVSTAPVWRYSMAASEASCAACEVPPTASETTRQW